MWSSVSVLVTAVMCHHHGLVSEILNRGADPNLPCPESGWTALHMAVLSDEFDDWNTPAPMAVIAELLKGDADPNIRDYTGCTPFHHFTHRYHNEETQTAGVITWVDYGANPDIQNNDGSNCWSCGNHSLLASLREKNSIIG